MNEPGIPLVLLTITVALMIGCGGNNREEVEAIKQTYAEFRMALLKQNHTAATNYLSSDLLGRHPNPNQLLVNFSRGLTNAQMKMELTDDAWVRFQHNGHAFLFPRRPPTVGRGFVKETNGWKITVEVIPIVD